MNGFLIDTNVVSEFAKPEPTPKVIDWLRSADPDSLYVSTIVFGEIWLGIENLPTGLSIGTADGLLAATALEHNLVLVTRDIGDVAGVNLPILNPWDI